MSSTRYLGLAVSAAAGLLVLGALTVVVVDPKGLFALVRIDGFNSYKAYQNLYTAEVKALAVRRFRPDTVIFGASPATFGIVPHCAFPSMPGVSRIYNYGGVGPQVYTTNTNYSDLRAIGSIRRMVIEARLPDSRFVHGAADRPAQPVPEEKQGVWAEVVRPWIPANYADVYLANLFSWHEIILSLQTVAANLQSDRSFLFYGFAPNGAYDQVWLRRWTAWVITNANLRGQIVNYRNLLVSKVSNNMDVDFSHLDALAAKAARDGIALDFFVTPEHVAELLLYYEGNIWPLFEKFKRSLLRAAEAGKSRYGIEFRVFDFGTLNDVMTQPIRQIDTKTVHDPYFGDPVHYRKPIGDFILSTMYGCKIDEAVPSDFGLELRRDNIDAHLASEKAKLEAYRRADPELVHKVQSALRD
jgi:hypothetical protein